MQFIACWKATILKTKYTISAFNFIYFFIVHLKSSSSTSGYRKNYAQTIGTVTQTGSGRENIYKDFMTFALA